MTATTRYQCLALALVAGMAAHRFATARAPAGVDAYHSAIRAAAVTVPQQIGGWVGQEAPIPPRAVAVYDPNVLVSRRYLNVETGGSASLLLVHCTDAHDMVGHYPLRCYPAQGWSLRSQRPRDWAVGGGLTIQGTEYEFARAERGVAKAEQVIVVANCLLRPGGQMFREMRGMSRSILGAGGQASGAGQVQVYFDARVPDAQRDAAVVELLAGYRPVIEAILAGVER